MMNEAQTQAYKEEIADYYSRRSQAYDDSAWHDQIARKLVELAEIRADASVLDIATGTGMVAIMQPRNLALTGRWLGSISLRE